MLSNTYLGPEDSKHHLAQEQTDISNPLLPIHMNRIQKSTVMLYANRAITQEHSSHEEECSQQVVKPMHIMFSQ